MGAVADEMVERVKDQVLLDSTPAPEHDRVTASALRAARVRNPPARQSSPCGDNALRLDCAPLESTPAVMGFPARAHPPPGCGNDEATCFFRQGPFPATP